MTYGQEIRAFEFINAAQRQSAAQFAQAHPYPFLIANLPEGENRDDFFTSLRPSSRPSDISALPPSGIHPGALVFPVTKHGDRNPYSEMVTIGRGKSCDIVLARPGISKFHAYIEIKRTKGDLFFFADAGSRNGTWLNDQRLKSRESCALHSGDRLQLGADVVLAFHLIQSFWEVLRGEAGRPEKSL